MRPETHKALLVIADISGFTQFMKSHQEAASHAMPVRVVVELLKAVISAASLPGGTLKLAEVEGDAAFFYAVCHDTDSWNRRDRPSIARALVRWKPSSSIRQRSLWP